MKPIDWSQFKPVEEASETGTDWSKFTPVEAEAYRPFHGKLDEPTAAGYRPFDGELDVVEAPATTTSRRGGMRSEFKPYVPAQVGSAQDVRRLDNQIEADTAQPAQTSAARKALAAESPHTGALMSGLSGVATGLLNAPSVAADYLNTLVVNPLANAVGAPTLPRAANMPGADYFAKAAQEYMPDVGAQPMSKAWDDSKFVPWLTTNMAAQAPQMAMSLAAALVPPLRAAILPTMGAQSAGQAFQQGDSSSAAMSKGIVEGASELLPLGVFDKAKSMILALPQTARGAVFTEAAKRLTAGGAAITASHLAEGLEEAAAKIGENAIDIYGSGQTKSIWDGVPDATVIGAAMGGAMGVPNAVSALRGQTDATNAQADIARAIDGVGIGGGQGAQPTLNPHLGGVTSFTPADSLSAQVGLPEIVVPVVPRAATAAPQELAAQGEDIAAIAAQSGDSASVPQRPAGAAGQADASFTAERALEQRLMAELGIPPPDAPTAPQPSAQSQAQATTVQATTAAPAASSGDVVQSRQEAAQRAPAVHPTPAPRPGAGVAPAGAQAVAQPWLKSAATTATTPVANTPTDAVEAMQPEAQREPAQVWVGRGGDGYLTKGDAEQAINGRKLQRPDLEWIVESQEGGRFRLAGYASAGAEPAPAANISTGDTQPRASLASFERKADGTVFVHGTPAAVRAQISGIPGITTKGGVLYGKSAASEVIRRLSGGAPAPQQAEDTAEGGQASSKVHKTRREATIARQALGNTHRLQRVPGGYKLRVATEKELAASARSGERLKRAGASIDVDRDTLLTAISKAGGLAMSERADTIGSGNRNAGGRMLFTNTGRTVDVMATILDQDGFIPPEEMESDGGVRWLRDAIAAEFLGTQSYHSHSGDAWMRRARYEALGDAPDFEAIGVSNARLKDSGYLDADADVQAAIDAIIAAEIESREQRDEEAIERFWDSLAGIENEQERHAIQTESDQADDTEAGARPRRVEEPSTREAQAGDADRARSAGQEEGSRQSLTREAGAGKGDLRFSKSATARDESAALQALSENDQLFALPKSAASTVEQIAADNDPKIKASAEIRLSSAESMYTLTLPSGGVARITVRKPDPKNASVYSAELRDGGYDWNTTRPGDNPQDVGADVEDVWIDVSDLKSGDGGRVVYNIAATFAHNTGRIFIGDPAALSDAAMRRRPEQMLSSALKFGATRHLAPHPRQVKGDASIGVPPLQWVYGDDLGNIRRLIEVNLAALGSSGADLLTFDLATGEFHDESGRAISRADITAASSAGLGGKGFAGGNTLARGAVLRAPLRSEGEGLGDQNGGRDGLLAGLVRQSAAHPTAVADIFYSRASKRYQADLFGDEFPELFDQQPLPDDAGAGRDGSSRPAADGRNVDTAAGVPEGTYGSTTALVTTGQQQLGHSGPVLGAADAAAALAYLNRNAVERFDALVTDKDGKPLAVIGGFKGALSQASVYPATLVGEAIRIPGAANVWLVHNHPSGSASLSKADLSLQEEIARVFDGTGIAVREIIAVAGSNFAAGSGGYERHSKQPIKAARSGPAVPRQEREIASSDKLAPEITTTSDARQAARELAAANDDKPGLMLLDAQHRPIAYVPWAPAHMSPLKGNGKLDALFRAVSYSNAGAAVIVDPRSEYTTDQINNVASALRAIDVRALDAIQGDRALSATGELNPGRVFKSSAEAGSPDNGLASSADLADALKTAFPSLGKAFDKMLAKGERGEKGGLVVLESSNLQDMAQALASKSGQTIEQAAAVLGAAGPETVFKSRDNQTQGFYSRTSGLTFIVLPNVTAATVPSVVLHEVVHGQQRAAIDTKALALVRERESATHPKATREFLGRVAQRLQDAGESDNAQEATAYLVEQAVLEGRQAGHSVADGRFLTWVDKTLGKRVGGVIRDLVAAMRAWALRRGVELTPTVDDLVAFAKAGVRSAAKGDVVGIGKLFDFTNKAHRDAVFAKLGETPLSDDSLAEGGWEVLEDPDVVRAVKAAGFDGMYIIDQGDAVGNGARLRTVPLSRKSAELVAGEAADPADAMMAADTAAKAPPGESWGRKVQRFGQDSMNRFTVVKSWAEANGVKLSDDADVWSHEERMHGRIASRLEDFRKGKVAPLVKKIQAAGYSMEQIGEHLHMAHAEERNRQIEKGNPGFKDGSGIQTSTARAYLAKADPKLAALANEVRAITQDTLDVLLKAGIINTDMTSAFSGAYKHYVPLKGNAGVEPIGSDAEGAKKANKGNSVDGEIARAEGRTGGVDKTIVENILRAYESAVVQSERNVLGHSLIAFTTEIANPLVATIESGDIVKRTAGRVGSKVFEVVERRHDKENPVVLRTFENKNDALAWAEGHKQAHPQSEPEVRTSVGNIHADAFSNDGGPRLADNEVRVYVAGHAVKVTLRDAGLSRAYQRLGMDQLPVYLAMGQTINRWLSKAYTGLNPEFSAVNPVRDFTTGVMNITGQFGAKAAARAVAGYPKALGQMLAYAFAGKKSADIDAYRASGGSTGAAYLGDIERIGADIRANYHDYVGATRLAMTDGKRGAAVGAASRKLVRGLTGWIENLNSATENAFRLATFVALRKEHGANVAASAAKNATVNFNRRGELGQATGALYLFFNPAVQGTAAMLDALVHGDHKRQARALVGALAATAYALTALQYGDDDDEQAELNAIPDYVRSRSLVIRTGKGEQITLPIPYGYGFAISVANAMYSATHGGDIDTISMGLASSLLENFSPVGNPLAGADRWRDAEAKGLLELIPGFVFGDLTKDAIRLAANRSGLGHQIIPDNTSFDESKPDSMKAFRTTRGSAFDKIARALSDATGGTATQAGRIDISPETLKFWTRAITGGTGTFVADSARLAELGARSLAGEEGDLTPELREIPIARKFARENDIRDARSQYWAAAKVVDRARDDLTRARRGRDDEGREKVEREQAAQLEVARVFVNTSKRIKHIRDQIDEIVQDDSIKLGMKRIQIKELEAEERELYEEAAREYEIAVQANKEVPAGR